MFAPINSYAKFHVENILKTERNFVLKSSLLLLSFM